MGYVRATVSLDQTTLNPEDIVTNTSYWLMPEDTSHCETLAGNLHEFYSDISIYMSSMLAGSGRITMWALADPEPRAPIFDSPWPALSFGISNYPLEVACCLSSRAAPSSGIPASSLRNRQYIGPLSEAAVETSVLVNNEPSIAFREACVDAWVSIAQEMDPENIVATVYSTKEAVGRTPVAYWMDNAWDTQRRRGRRATERYQVLYTP